MREDRTRGLKKTKVCRPSLSHHVKKFLMTLANFLVSKGNLEIKFNTKHGSPGREVPEQHCGVGSLADDNTTSELRAMGSADQFKPLKSVTLSSTGHVLDQFGIRGFLAFNVRKLPGDVVELHGKSFSEASSNRIDCAVVDFVSMNTSLTSTHNGNLGHWIQLTHITKE